MFATEIPYSNYIFHGFSQENECFQEELRKAQRALLRVRRDKSFLLDRLLQYQRGPDSSSDSEQTEESDTETDTKLEAKR